MNARKAFLGIFCICGCSLLHSLTPAEDLPAVLNSSGAVYRSYIDWQNQEVHISVTAELTASPSDERNRLSALSRQESVLRDFYTSIFPKSLEKLQVNSRNVVFDFIRTDAETFKNLSFLSSRRQALKPKPSKDLKSLSLENIVPLFPGFADLFARNRTARELERVLNWQPQLNYTGVIVYAVADLPWYGTDENSQLKPSLFPRIFDQNLRLIVDVESVHPDMLRQWGSVGFSDDTVYAQKHVRTGDKPLVISARGVYGVKPTDVLISKNDADLLLYNDSTRKALQEGRVVIIIGSELLHEKL